MKVVPWAHIFKDRSSHSLLSMNLAPGTILEVPVPLNFPIPFFTVTPTIWRYRPRDIFYMQIHGF